MSSIKSIFLVWEVTLLNWFGEETNKFSNLPNFQPSSLRCKGRKGSPFLSPENLWVAVLLTRCDGWFNENILTPDKKLVLGCHDIYLTLIVLCPLFGMDVFEGFWGILGWSVWMISWFLYKSKLMFYSPTTGLLEVTCFVFQKLQVLPCRSLILQVAN